MSEKECRLSFLFRFALWSYRFGGVTSYSRPLLRLWRPHTLEVTSLSSAVSTWLLRRYLACILGASHSARRTSFFFCLLKEGPHIVCVSLLPYVRCILFFFF